MGIEDSSRMAPDANAATPANRGCSLLIFVTTPAEEEGLRNATTHLGLSFDKIGRDRSPFGEEYHWLGEVGNETVISIRPARRAGTLIMGSIGYMGTSARGMRLRMATGAQSIVQLGMAFGINPEIQSAADVLVSEALIPYDNRDMKPLADGIPGYFADYQQVRREYARPALVELFRREQRRGGHGFGVHMGAILSGAARIHTRHFRDELVQKVPAGEHEIVGGEMEAVGLLAASGAVDDPIWCVVKGISDFADEDRDGVIEANRPIACLNAATFVLSALMRDVEG